MKPSLKTNIAGIEMKNPVTTASGTFGSGQEYSHFFDLSRLGAITVKSLTLNPKEGNSPPRVAETPSGILNCIGLQNKGVEQFILEDLDFLGKLDIPIIASVAGNTFEEYVKVARKLEKTKKIAALELNISCPNIEKGGLFFGEDPSITARVVSRVRESVNIPIIPKLTPNVTNIKEIAKSVEQAGADAISLINTLRAMAIDVKTFKSKLSKVTGGLSGPAIKPIAVRMVWEVAQVTKLPIIGMGGIVNVEDALEFFLAGASAIAVGTANFLHPKTTIEIIEGLEKFLEEKKLTNINQIIGKVKNNSLKGESRI